MSEQERAAVLREAAEVFRTEMAGWWGGDSAWLTTGTKVASLVAGVLDEMADEASA